MNDSYETLPPELKLLAEKYQEPYDDGYDYNKDFQLFFKYEKEFRGVTDWSIFTLSSSGNYACYQCLVCHYSKNNNGGSTGGVFF